MHVQYWARDAIMLPPVGAASESKAIHSGDENGADMDDEYEPMNDVQVLMEISGGYDDVMTKLHASARGRGAIDRFVQDINVLLDTVIDLRGGTRSAIANELPAEMNLRYDAEMVVKTLQVLEGYGLVQLEGNTWMPGETL